MRDRFLLPQLGEMRFVHELPLVELCNGLVAGALARGFERLEVLAPQVSSAIAEIRGYKGSPGVSTSHCPRRCIARLYGVSRRWRRFAARDPPTRRASSGLSGFEQAD